MHFLSIISRAHHARHLNGIGKEYIIQEISKMIGNKTLISGVIVLGFSNQRN